MRVPARATWPSTIWSTGRPFCKGIKKSLQKIWQVRKIRSNGLERAYEHPRTSHYVTSTVYGCFIHVLNKKYFFDLKPMFFSNVRFFLRVWVTWVTLDDFGRILGNPDLLLCESTSKKNRTTGGFWFKTTFQVVIGLRCQILSAKRKDIVVPG